MLFISHRFEEVFALCQRVTVMRDGAWIATDPLDELTVDGLIRRMVGRELDELFPKQDAEIGEVALERAAADPRGRLLRHLLRGDGAARSSASAGLVGAGRTEVARAVFGIDRYDAGEVAGRRRAADARRPAHCDGRRARLRPRGPAPAGPGHGACPSSGTSASPALGQLSRAGLMHRGAERSRALDWADQAPGQVRPARRRPSPRSPAATSRRSSSPSGWPPAPGC